LNDDYEAAETAAQTAVFGAAAAILSGGAPLSPKQIGLIRTAMENEGLPPGLMDDLSSQFTKGMDPKDVRVMSGLDQAQAALFAASLILYALRSSPQADPLAVAIQLCTPYGVSPKFVRAFARELAKEGEAQRSPDLAANIRLLLDPPAMLQDCLDRYQAAARPKPAPRRSFANVSPSRIQDPSDREASEAIRDIAGFESLVKYVMEKALEKMQRVNNVGGKVRVGPKQFPGLYEIFQGCVARSGVSPEPELYLDNGPINAYTYGTERPFIVLYTGAITLLSRVELEFIIGHELGHIRFKHVLNLTLARNLPWILGSIPGGSLAEKPLSLALFNWERKAELSADRMGLLVSQDPDAALTVMVKLSGVPAALYRAVNIEAFLDQYDDFQAISNDTGGAMAKFLQTATMDHPWTVVRANALRNWVKEGHYQKFLNEGSSQRGPGTSIQLPMADLLSFECPVCKSVMAADQLTCRSCGSPFTERDRFHRCQRCGAPGKPSSRFCESCGTKQPTAVEVS